MPTEPPLPKPLRDAIDNYGWAIVGAHRDEDDPLLPEFIVAFAVAHRMLVARLADLHEAARLGRRFVEAVVKGWTLGDDPAKLLTEINTLMGGEG